MPSLSNVNNLIKSYNRVTTILINEAFASGVGGFSASAGTEQVATVTNDGSGRLSVKCNTGSSNAYAYQSFSTTINTVYSYSLTLIASGAGNGSIKIGTSAGNHSLVNQAVEDLQAYTGTFTATSTTTFLSLVTNNAGRILKWDDIVLKENN